jgi:hypothetical protein
LEVGKGGAGGGRTHKGGLLLRKETADPNVYVVFKGNVMFIPRQGQ